MFCRFLTNVNRALLLILILSTTVAARIMMEAIGRVLLRKSPVAPNQHSPDPLPGEGIHSCEHCRDICLDIRPAIQSEHAAILLGTTPEDAAARLEADYSTPLPFIPMTEERIQGGLDAGCKFFTLLGDDYRRLQDPATSTASQIFLVAEIREHSMRFGYLRRLPTIPKHQHYRVLVASQGRQDSATT
jgi:hypothetical protein